MGHEMIAKPSTKSLSFGIDRILGQTKHTNNSNTDGGIHASDSDISCGKWKDILPVDHRRSPNTDHPALNVTAFPHTNTDHTQNKTLSQSLSTSIRSRNEPHSKCVTTNDAHLKPIPQSPSPCHSPTHDNHNTKPLSAFHDLRHIKKSAYIIDANNNFLHLQNSQLLHTLPTSITTNKLLHTLPTSITTNKLPLLLPKPFHVPNSNDVILPSPPTPTSLHGTPRLSPDHHPVFLDERDSFVSAFRLNPQYYTHHNRFSILRDVAKDNPVLIGFRAGLPVLSGIGSAGQTPHWKETDLRRSSHPSCHGRCHQTKRKKPRTSFTRLQILELEKRFHRQKYLASNERSSLAKGLKMTDAQVKTWFQNRRTKWRRQTAEERDAERQAATRLMLTLETEPCKTPVGQSKDALCLGNSSLHALQNMQPWSDDDDVDDEDNDGDDEEIDVNSDEKDQRMDDIDINV